MRNQLFLIALALSVTTAAVARQEQRPAFRGAVDLVRVDVIVTDESGRFVADLQADDFRVFEDGAEQSLVDVQLVDLGRDSVRRIATNSGPGVRAGSPPPIAGSTSNPAAGDLGAIVFLIDGTTIDTVNKARFVAAWREALAATELTGVPRAVYVVDSDRRVRQIAPFTTDAQELETAADAVEDMAAFGNAIFRQMADLADRIGEPGVGWEVRSFEAEEAQRSAASLRYLTEVCSALGTRPGRKALVWVSAGVKLTEGGPYTALLMEAAEGDLIGSAMSGAGRGGGGSVGREFGGQEFASGMPDRSVAEAQEDLHEVANSANVSIYPLDPTQSWELRQLGDSVRSRSPVMANLLSSAGVQSALAGMRDPLRDAAAETGGRPFIHSTELARALAEIEEDTSRFYLLAYEPASPEDGEYHEIRVEVSRSGVEVRQRQGYLALGTTERQERGLAAALMFPGVSRALDVSAEVFKKWNTVGEPVVQVALAVDGVSPVVIDPTGGDASPLRVAFMAIDELGHTVWRADQDVIRRVAAQEVVRGSGRFVYFDPRWRTLEPGRHDFRAAALDRVSGRVGATTVVVDVPERSAGWRTSDLMLGLVDASGSVQPVVSGRTPVDRPVHVFAELYGAGAPRAEVRVLRRPEGGAGDGEVWRETDVVLRRYADNIHRVDFELPPFQQPGDYLVELTIVEFNPRHRAVLQAKVQAR